jgi:hypothetical protein
MSLISAGLVHLSLFLIVIEVRSDFFSIGIVITIALHHVDAAICGLLLEPGIAGFTRVVHGWSIFFGRRILLRCLIGRNGRSFLKFSNIDRSWQVSLNRDIDSAADILVLELGGGSCGWHLWKRFTSGKSENLFRAAFTFVVFVAKYRRSLSFGTDESHVVGPYDGETT